MFLSRIIQKQPSRQTICSIKTSSVTELAALPGFPPPITAPLCTAVWENICLQQHHRKCGPRTSSFGITWELVRHADSQTLKSAPRRDICTPEPLPRYSQEPSHGKHLRVNAQMKGQRRRRMYTTESYSALRKEVLPFAMAWMTLGGIMLSEISRIRRRFFELHDFTRMWNLKISNTQSREWKDDYRGTGQRGNGEKMVQGGKAAVVLDA